MSSPTLTAAELRALQQPLKEGYRQDPASAVVTNTVVGQIHGDRIATTVHGWAGPVEAGLHPAAGGDGSQACSADILLEAVAACAGVTLRSVATALGVDLRSGTVTVTGQWDARGTLGVDRAAPVGLTSVDIAIAVDTDADPATVDKLVALTERYCVVAQTLAHPPEVTIRRDALPS